MKPVVLAVALVATACTVGGLSPGSGGSTASPTPRPTVSAAPAIVGAVDVAGHPVAPAIALEASAAVPPPPSAATPTPTPDPAVWRFEGRVVDEEGNGLTGVCVAIGPNGCQPGSIRTDARGTYAIDLPQIRTIVYELRFQLAGYTTVYHRFSPNGASIFDVVLPRG